MGKRIQLKLSQEQASALIGVLDDASKDLLREISEHGYSQEFRDFLKGNYENIEAVRSALEDACEQAETTFTLSLENPPGSDRAGHQAM